MGKHVKLLNEELDIPFKNECSVLELLLKKKINIDHSCGGMGSCGTCRILIKSDLKKLPPRNEVEAERAAELRFQDEERLACQLCPLDGLEFEIPY